MFDDQGLPIREAQPSTPVEVIGLDSLPEVGDAFQVVTDTAKAKQIVVYREAKARDAAMAKAKQRICSKRSNMQMQSGSDAKDLNIIIKTDVGGTAEVLSETLQKLSTDKVRVRVLRQGVGAISEADVLLASASNAIIHRLQREAGPNRRRRRRTRTYRRAVPLDHLRSHRRDQKGHARPPRPVYREIYKGKAEVREIFRITKVGNVAGCHVTDGTITRNSEVRIVRNGETVHAGRSASSNGSRTTQAKSATVTSRYLRLRHQRYSGRRHPRSLPHGAGHPRFAELEWPLWACSIWNCTWTTPSPSKRNATSSAASKPDCAVASTSPSPKSATRTLTWGSWPLSPSPPAVPTPKRFSKGGRRGGRPPRRHAHLAPG
jgi:hypothetical protein